MSDPTDMYLMLRTSLTSLTRQPTAAEVSMIRSALTKWFGKPSIEHSLFVGPHAAGLEQKHGGVVNSDSHYVTFKVDGLAQLLFAPRIVGTTFIETVFFVDRRQQIRALDGLRFEFDGGKGPVLLDGELAFRRRIQSEREHSEAKRASKQGFVESYQHRVLLGVDREHFSLETHELCFVVADCPVSRRRLTSQPLQSRLQAARFLVHGKVPVHMNPAHADKTPPIVRNTEKAKQLQIIYKPHQHGKHFPMLRRDVFPFLVGMPIDGFILTPTRVPYAPGNCETLFKLKPAGRCEIDFVVQQEGPNNYALFAAGPNKTLIRWKFQTLHTDHQLRSGAVVELLWHNDSFRLLRVRDDKRFPNSLRAAIAMVKAAREPVTYDMVETWLGRAAERGAQ